MSDWEETSVDSFQIGQSIQKPTNSSEVAAGERVMWLGIA